MNARRQKETAAYPLAKPHCIPYNGKQSKANRLRLLRVRIMEELRQDLVTLTQKIAAVVERL